MSHQREESRLRDEYENSELCNILTFEEWKQMIFNEKLAEHQKREREEQHAQQEQLWQGRLKEEDLMAEIARAGLRPVKHTNANTSARVEVIAISKKTEQNRVFAKEDLDRVTSARRVWPQPSAPPQDDPEPTASEQIHAIRHEHPSVVIQAALWFLDGIIEYDLVAQTIQMSGKRCPKVFEILEKYIQSTK